MEKPILALIFMGVAVLIGALYIGFNKGVFHGLTSTTSRSVNSVNYSTAKVSFITPMNSPIVFKYDPGTDSYYAEIQYKTNVKTTTPLIHPFEKGVKVQLVSVNKTKDGYVNTVKVVVPKKDVDKLQNGMIHLGSANTGAFAVIEPIFTKVSIPNITLSPSTAFVVEQITNPAYTPTTTVSQGRYGNLNLPMSGLSSPIQGSVAPEEEPPQYMIFIESSVPSIISSLMGAQDTQTITPLGGIEHGLEINKTVAITKPDQIFSSFEYPSFYYYNNTYYVSSLPSDFDVAYRVSLVGMSLNTSLLNMPVDPELASYNVSIVGYDGKIYVFQNGGKTATYGYSPENVSKAIQYFENNIGNGIGLIYGIQYTKKLTLSGSGTITIQTSDIEDADIGQFSGTLFVIASKVKIYSNINGAKIIAPKYSYVLIKTNEIKNSDIAVYEGYVYVNSIENSVFDVPNAGVYAYVGSVSNSQFVIGAETVNIGTITNSASNIMGKNVRVNTVSGGTLSVSAKELNIGTMSNVEDTEMSVLNAQIGSIILSKSYSTIAFMYGNYTVNSVTVNPPTNATTPFEKTIENTPLLIGLYSATLKTGTLSHVFITIQGEFSGIIADEITNSAIASGDYEDEEVPVSNILWEVGKVVNSTLYLEGVKKISNVYDSTVVVVNGEGDKYPNTGELGEEDSLVYVQNLSNDIIEMDGFYGIYFKSGYYKNITINDPNILICGDNNVVFDGLRAKVRWFYNNLGSDSDSLPVNITNITIKNSYLDVSHEVFTSPGDIGNIMIENSVIKTGSDFIYSEVDFTGNIYNITIKNSNISANGEVIYSDEVEDSFTISNITILNSEIDTGEWSNVIYGGSLAKNVLIENSIIKLGQNSYLLQSEKENVTVRSTVIFFNVNSYYERNYMTLYGGNYDNVVVVIDDPNDVIKGQSDKTYHISFSNLNATNIYLILNNGDKSGGTLGLYVSNSNVSNVKFYSFGNNTLSVSGSITGTPSQTIVSENVTNDSEIISFIRTQLGVNAGANPTIDVSSGIPPIVLNIPPVFFFEPVIRVSFSSPVEVIATPKTKNPINIIRAVADPKLYESESQNVRTVSAHITVEPSSLLYGDPYDSLFYESVFPLYISPHNDLFNVSAYNLYGGYMTTKGLYLSHEHTIMPTFIVNYNNITSIYNTAKKMLWTSNYGLGIAYSDDFDYEDMEYGSSVLIYNSNYGLVGVPKEGLNLIAYVEYDLSPYKDLRGMGLQKISDLGILSEFNVAVYPDNNGNVGVFKDGKLVKVFSGTGKASPEATKNIIEYALNLTKPGDKVLIIGVPLDNVKIRDLEVYTEEANLTSVENSKVFGYEVIVKNVTGSFIMGGDVNAGNVTDSYISGNTISVYGNVSDSKLVGIEVDTGLSKGIKKVWIKVDTKKPSLTIRQYLKNSELSSYYTEIHNTNIINSSLFGLLDIDEGEFDIYMSNINSSNIDCWQVYLSQVNTSNSAITGLDIRLHGSKIDSSIIAGSVDSVGTNITGSTLVDYSKTSMTDTLVKNSTVYFASYASIPQWELGNEFRYAPGRRGELTINNSVVYFTAPNEPYGNSQDYTMFPVSPVQMGTLGSYDAVFESDEPPLVKYRAPGFYSGVAEYVPNSNGIFAFLFNTGLTIENSKVYAYSSPTIIVTGRLTLNNTSFTGLPYDEIVTTFEPVQTGFERKSDESLTYGKLAGRLPLEVPLKVMVSAESTISMKVPSEMLPVTPIIVHDEFDSANSRITYAGIYSPSMDVNGSSFEKSILVGDYGNLSSATIDFSVLFYNKALNVTGSTMNNVLSVEATNVKGSTLKNIYYLEASTIENSTLTDIGFVKATNVTSSVFSGMVSGSFDNVRNTKMNVVGIVSVSGNVTGSTINVRPINAVSDSGSDIVYSIGGDFLDLVSSIAGKYINIPDISVVYSIRDNAYINFKLPVNIINSTFNVGIPEKLKIEQMAPWGLDYYYTNKPFVVWNYTKEIINSSVAVRIPTTLKLYFSSKITNSTLYINATQMVSGKSSDTNDISIGTMHNANLTLVSDDVSASMVGISTDEGWNSPLSNVTLMVSTSNYPMFSIYNVKNVYVYGGNTTSSMDVYTNGNITIKFDNIGDSTKTVHMGFISGNGKIMFNSNSINKVYLAVGGFNGVYATAQTITSSNVQIVSSNEYEGNVIIGLINSSTIRLAMVNTTIDTIKNSSARATIDEGEIVRVSKVEDNSKLSIELEGDENSNDMFARVGTIDTNSTFAVIDNSFYSGLNFRTFWASVGTIKDSRMYIVPSEGHSEIRVGVNSVYSSNITVTDNPPDDLIYGSYGYAVEGSINEDVKGDYQANSNAGIEVMARSTFGSNLFNVSMSYPINISLGTSNTQVANTIILNTSANDSNATIYAPSGGYNLNNVNNKFHVTESQNTGFVRGEVNTIRATVNSIRVNEPPAITYTPVIPALPDIGDIDSVDSTSYTVTTGSTMAKDFIMNEYTGDTNVSSIPAFNGTIDTNPIVNPFGVVVKVGNTYYSAYGSVIIGEFKEKMELSYNSTTGTVSFHAFSLDGNVTEYKYDIARTGKVLSGFIGYESIDFAEEYYTGYYNDLMSVLGNIASVQIPEPMVGLNDLERYIEQTYIEQIAKPSYPIYEQ